MRLLTVTLALLLALIGRQVPAAGDQVPDTLAAALPSIIPGVKPDRIEPSPIDGLYEVYYGPSVVYVTGDGRYVVRGDILETGTHTNLSEEKRRAARLRALQALGEDQMIVFAPEGETKHTITVFTDTTCPYCRKLHQERDELNALGIKIRYLAFPRAGVPSAAANQMVSVWCADDPRQALTDAKAGRTVPERDCDNPVSQEYDLGRLFGVRGTPTIVLDDGRIVPGYVPADRLAKILAQPAGG